MCRADRQPALRHGQRVPRAGVARAIRTPLGQPGSRVLRSRAGLAAGRVGNAFAPLAVCPLFPAGPFSQPMRDGRLGPIRMTGRPTPIVQLQPGFARCVRLSFFAGLALQYAGGSPGTIKTECEHQLTMPSKRPA